MIRFLMGILALGSSCLPALAADPPTRTDAAESPPMRFERRVEGPPERCGNTCRSWISAIGIITQDTPHDFEVFANGTKVQGATLVLDSEGGSVLAALAFGRAIRRLNMTTTVGKTVALSSDDGEAWAELSPHATCESMCAFVLLGGARRYVSPEARVLVHMIWIGEKSGDAQEESYTAEELGLVQHDIGSLARYTVEMGGAIELLDTALRIPPWKPMYALAAEEVRSMRLTTLDRLFEDNMAPIAAEVPRRTVPTVASANPLGTGTHTQGENE
jgi:hypothetical protein